MYIYMALVYHSTNTYMCRYIFAVRAIVLYRVDIQFHCYQLLMISFGNTKSCNVTAMTSHARVKQRMRLQVRNLYKHFVNSQCTHHFQNYIEI